jgi:tRNA(fMet)-specific endonuclease VapC
MSGAKIILDTNIVSYLMKGGPLAEAYLPHIQSKLLAITFITVGEMYYGAEKANWGAAKRKKLETELRNFVVIPHDHEIARCYGRLVAERQRAGTPIAPNDAWIAACRRPTCGPVGNA